ncbi:MAG: tRNA pseudouridine(38-40) synthase TruA [Thermoplasmata archaeon]|nr:tRNA pseudouridine(38-40) synthase TruA [Thermoplasmata archaeon]
MLQRIALRIAYDGRKFNGFQRQPNKRTVEGDIITALRNIRAIGDPKSSNYRCSSRTDSGVSAVGNVISIDTSFREERLAGALNSKLKDIWCTGTAIIPMGFNVRHAINREYAYYLPDIGQNISNMRESARCFVGEHDFTKYARAEKRNPIRRISRVGIRKKGMLIEIRIKGESFLWNQVRRIVWALNEVGKGSAQITDISPESFRLRRIGLAPADNLVLLDVDIGYEFKIPDLKGNAPFNLRNSLIESELSSILYNNISAIMSLRFPGDR